MRYAIYFTPPHDDPLTQAAARWLGRDPFTGEAVQAPSVPGLSAEELACQTASARRYGFHATLKAPFTLAPGESEHALLATFDNFAASVEPVHLPAMKLRQISRFFALTPAERSPALDRLAGEIVVAFDRFRAPMTDADIARRNPESLKPAELKHLHQWGYPYVFDSFFFHMTLSDRIAEADASRFTQAAQTFFGPLLGEPLDVSSLALFVEPEPGAPFTVLAHRPVGQMQQRKTA